MNAEHILDAMGLLDDDLIREAEEYAAVRRRFDYRRWGSLAASFVLIAALGYGAFWLSTGGDVRKGLDWSGTSGGAAENRPAASAPASGEPGVDAPAGGEALRPDDADVEQNGAERPKPEPDSPSGSVPAEPPASGAQGGDNCPAIMVDGALYFFTGEPAPVEPDPGAVRAAVSYTSGVPEMDGQTNFSEDLSAKYAMVQIGGEQKLVVLMEHEWILFDTVQPQA